MNAIEVIKSVAGLGGLSLIFGIVLAILPGCDAYAHALVEKTGEVPIDLCTVGGAETLRKIGEILGIEVETTEPMLCVLRCHGGRENAVEKFEYIGPGDCRSNYILLGGNKACQWGCLGGGHCETVCPFDAITMGPNRLPIIDPGKCTAGIPCL
jgi:Na+-translocating ferredoxin:NAD+ oxidoreductase RNF subunit RnfB